MASSSAAADIISLVETLAVPRAADPLIVEATIDRAIALLNAGDAPGACHVMETLETAGTLPPVATTLLGLVALSAGAPDKALMWTERALAMAPFHIDALKARGTVLAAQRRWPEAHVAFLRAFAAGCRDAAAFFNHGRVLQEMGLRDAAIAAYDQALQIQPHYPEALRAGGLILKETARHDEALRFWAEALRLKPDYLDAILDCANLLDHLDRPIEALAVLDDGLLRLPDQPQLLNNRGVVLFHLGRLSEASATFDRALARRPAFPEAYLNKGEVEIRQGLFAEARVSLANALALRPDYVKAHCAMGIALKLTGRFDAAAAAFATALSYEPTSVYARTNRGELSLLRGDFETGWVDYDFRFLTRGHDRPVLGWPVPEWAGEPNPGHVLVFADQASGDVIHFARYLPVLRAAAAEVTLVCRSRMQRLLAHASAGCHVIGAVPEAGAFDYQIPLSNMPLACRTTPANMPVAPYIVAEPALKRRWRKQIGTEGFKIGLCWRGSQDWRSDPKRSVPLGALRPLADVPGVRLVSLQMADNLGPDLDSFAAMRIETLGADLDTGPDGFVETVAVMANLDLIVTCDTSICHLAGAMGRPTFALLQLVPEWRFMVERDDSPWYPAMRLFRQIEQDCWDDPVRALVQAVDAMANGGKRRTPRKRTPAAGLAKKGD